MALITNSTRTTGPPVATRSTASFFTVAGGWSGVSLRVKTSTVMAETSRVTYEFCQSCLQNASGVHHPLAVSTVVQVTISQQGTPWMQEAPKCLPHPCLSSSSPLTTQPSVGREGKPEHTTPLWHSPRASNCTYNVVRTPRQVPRGSVCRGPCPGLALRSRCSNGPGLPFLPSSKHIPPQGSRTYGSQCLNPCPASRNPCPAPRAGVVVCSRLPRLTDIHTPQQLPPQHSSEFTSCAFFFFPAAFFPSISHSRYQNL